MMETSINGLTPSRKKDTEENKENLWWVFDSICESFDVVQKKRVSVSPKKDEEIFFIVCSLRSPSSSIHSDARRCNECARALRIVTLALRLVRWIPLA